MQVSELTADKLAKATSVPAPQCQEILKGVAVIAPKLAAVKRRGNTVEVHFDPYEATQSVGLPEVKIMRAHGCSVVVVHALYSGIDGNMMVIRESGTQEALRAAIKDGYRNVPLAQLAREIEKAWKEGSTRRRHSRRWR